MVPVAVQDPVLGSYSSAEARMVNSVICRPPPATSTLPSGSSVAVAPLRCVIMSPVAVHDPLPGSYSSAEAPPPPAASTLPSGSSVAVWPPRGVRMLPVAVHEGAMAGTTDDDADGEGAEEISGLDGAGSG